MKRCLLFLLPALLLLASCSLEHRHYRSGYYIDRNGKELAGSPKNLRSFSPRPAASLEIAGNNQVICQNAGLIPEIQPEKPVLAPLPVHPAAVKTAPALLHRRMFFNAYSAAVSSAMVKDTFYVQSRERILHPDIARARGLGVASIVGTFLLGCGILLAPFCIFYASRALRGIYAEPDRYTGEREARNAMTMGICVLVFNLLIIAFALIMITVVL